VRRALIVVALARTAAADPLDEIGMGAAGAGMANARTAVATGAEATHLDPAGVARASGPELLLGYQYTIDHLSIDEHDAHEIDAHGTTIALAVPVAVGDVRLGFGTAVYLPDQFLARLQVAPIADPHFVRFETQSQRIVVEPVASVAFGNIAVGAGASLLADTRSKQLSFDVGVVGGETQGQADLDISLPVRAAPVAGVWWHPHPKVDVAATFRGQLSLDLALDIRANVNVPGVVTGDAIVSMRSVDYFTPMRGTLAAAIHATDDLTITADATWEHWSALGSGVPDLRVLVALDIAPPLVSSMQPPADFHDIVTTRLGAEWQRDNWRFRAGAAYLPSPVPAQTGITSFADGARIAGTAGAGLHIAPGAVVTKPLDVDVAVGWQHVAHALVHKDMDLDPGGAYTSGGDIVQASVSTTVRF
jgi:long-subunit fatty acid transport protein